MVIKQQLGLFLSSYFQEHGTLKHFPPMSDDEWAATIPDKLAGVFRERLVANMTQPTHRQLTARDPLRVEDLLPLAIKENV